MREGGQAPTLGSAPPLLASATGERVRVVLLVALLLAALVVVVYAQTAGFDFVDVDDTIYVSSNPMVQTGVSAQGVAWAFALSHPERTYWHPLTWLAHMLDWQLFGPHPAGHHLVNVALHLASTILLFLFLQRATLAWGPSALVAALFAVHPLNVEAVAWVAELKSVLSTLLLLLTLHAWLGWVARPRPWRYALVCLWLSLGLLTKPVLVSVPLLLLVLDLWPLGRLRLAAEGASDQPPPRLAALVVEKLPLLALAIAAVALSSLSLWGTGSFAGGATVPFGLRLENALVSLLRYPWKLLAPVDLAFFYPFPRSVPLAQALGAAAGLLAVTAIACWQRWRRPYLLAGWLWYLISLGPMTGVLQVGLWPAMADRFAYVAAIGLFIILAWGGLELAGRFHLPGLAAAAAALVIAALTFAAWRQTAVWSSSLTLFEHAARVSPSSAAFSNLGSTLLDLGRTAEAVPQFERALALEPALAHAHNGLGIAFARLGNLPAAAEQFEQAVAIDPGMEEAHSNLERARRLLAQQRLPGAVTW